MMINFLQPVAEENLLLAVFCAASSKNVISPQRA